MTLSPALLVFVKAPVPGTVKTRLGQSIGPESACDLYRCFGVDVMARLRTLAWPILVFFSPSDAQATIEDWLNPSQCFPQASGDLGTRMCRAFEQGFEQGFDPLMIVGSDSPDIPLSIFPAALTALQANHCVLGPSDDGGYYTLGFSKAAFEPAIFSGVAWSTESVLSTTLNILQQQARSVHLLPPWHDIDTWEDLKRFAQRHQQDDVPLTSMVYLQTQAILTE